MSVVCVRTGRSQYFIDSDVIESTLPNLWHSIAFEPFNPFLDVRDLAKELFFTTSPIPVSFKTACMVLRSFFGIIHSQATYPGGILPSLIFRLQDFLHKDQVYETARGLRHSRAHFVTLAFLAARTDSVPLADALVRFFFLPNRRPIVDFEQPAYLLDWARAIDALHHLARTDHVHKALCAVARRLDAIRLHFRPHVLDDPYHYALVAQLEELLHRGRRGLLGPPPPPVVAAPRALSMPPLRRRSPAQMQLTLPPSAPIAVAYPSPSPSMDYALRANVEVESLRVQQEELEDRVQQLERNQEDLAMAMEEDDDI